MAGPGWSITASLVLLLNLFGFTAEFRDHHSTPAGPIRVFTKILIWMLELFLWGNAEQKMLQLLVATLLIYVKKALSASKKE